MGSVVSFITGLASVKGLVFGLLGLLVVAPIAYFIFKAILKNKMQKQAAEDTKKKAVEDHAKLIEQNDKNDKVTKADADKADTDMSKAIDKLKNKNP